jgi:hypothetical protein
MVQPVMSDGVRSDQQFKPEHPARKVPQRQRRHARPRFLLRPLPDPLGDAKQKGAGPGCRIEDCHGRIGEVRRLEILA